MVDNRLCFLQGGVILIQLEMNLGLRARNLLFYGYLLFSAAAFALLTAKVGTGAEGYVCAFFYCTPILCGIITCICRLVVRDSAMRATTAAAATIGSLAAIVQTLAFALFRIGDFETVIGWPLLCFFAAFVCSSELWRQYEAYPFGE